MIFTKRCLMNACVAKISFLIPAACLAVSQPANDTLFYPLKGSVNQSVMFVRLSDGKVLYEHDAKASLIPASIAKLATAAASLHFLSPHYAYQTRFYITGDRKAQQVNGDLVIEASGDPLLISEKMWQVAADIRHMGIRTITGDIVIDDSIFDSEIRDTSRKDFENFSVNAYDAPLSAFAINFNTFAIALAPAESSGKKAYAELDPYPLRGLSVDNRLVTSSNDRGGSFRVSRKTDKNSGTSMVVSGDIALDDPLQKVYRSVGDPIRASGEQVRAFLNKEGVIIQGQVHRGSVPKNAKLLTTLEGYPLSRIIESLNKYSNNYIADMLIKKLALKAGAKQGNLADGLKLVRQFLEKDVGLSDEFQMFNGSGLDTRSRFSAAQMTKLLAYMEKHFDLFPEYLNSLPAAGSDGTLKRRLGSKTDALQGIVRAKTGTLTSPVSVASLAGYIRHPKHGLVAFAVIDNGVPGQPQPHLADLRDRQDKGLEKFLSQF